jgi:ParB-like chromosome segregation protein Spo0J
MQMPKTTAQLEIQTWPIDRLILYACNPRKNDAVVDRMCSSIREFGFKIPVLARSDGEVVDGHLRIKAARKLGISDLPVILCDEWNPAQTRAFRLLVNRSVTWASWDEELLALELQELSEADFDLDLTGFNPGEIDGLLALPDEERANATPPVPENPVSVPATCGFAGRTACSAGTPPARRRWNGSFATGNRSSWLRTRPTVLSWTASGVTVRG